MADVLVSKLDLDWEVGCSKGEKARARIWTVWGSARCLLRDKLFALSLGWERATKAVFHDLKAISVVYKSSWLHTVADAPRWSICQEVGDTPLRLAPSSHAKRWLWTPYACPKLLYISSLARRCRFASRAQARRNLNTLARCIKNKCSDDSFNFNIWVLKFCHYTP